jgi:TRAP-type C4-dicarboxylate transport system permease small subunit
VPEDIRVTDIREAPPVDEATEVRTLPRILFLDGALRAAIVGLMLVMVGVGFLQVVGRYLVVLDWQLGWTEEVSRLTLVWTTFLGAAVLQRHGTQIRLTLVSRALGPTGRLVLRVVQDVVMIGFLAVLAYESVDVVQAGMGQVTPGLQAPAAIFSASLLVSALAMLAYTVVDVIVVARAVRQRRRSDSCR